MEPLAKYVLTLCCGALICGIILGISGTSGPGGAMRRLICGMFLALLAVSPLRDMDFGELDRDYEFFSQAAQAAAMDGKIQAAEALDEGISDRCRAYILDKAEALAVSLEAEVQVDPETHLPQSVFLDGNVTEQQKQVLTDYIARNLGIERSRQQWNPTR